MRLRHQVELHAFRDVGIGSYDARREFSEPCLCWANLVPVTAKRLIDDVNSFGRERAVTHIGTIRAMNIDQFSYLKRGDDWFRIFEQRESEDLRYLTIGVIFERNAKTETMSQEIFNA